MCKIYVASSFEVFLAAKKKKKKKKKKKDFKKIIKMKIFLK
jgi:hypothetical protein